MVALVAKPTVNPNSIIALTRVYSSMRHSGRYERYVSSFRIAGFRRRFMLATKGWSAQK